MSEIISVNDLAWSITLRLARADMLADVGYESTTDLYEAVAKEIQDELSLYTIVKGVSLTQ